MVPITVIKRNGHREIFNRSKLLHGLSRACEKTELTPSKLEAIVDELELSLQQSNSREITSSEIGELVLGHLKGSAKLLMSVLPRCIDTSEASAISSPPSKE